MSVECVRGIRSVKRRRRGGFGSIRLDDERVVELTHDLAL